MRSNPWSRSWSPNPIWRCAVGRAAVFPVVYVVGRDEVVTILYSRNRVVQGTRAAGPGRLGPPFGAGAHQARLGRTRADSAPTPNSSPIDGRSARATACSITRTWSPRGAISGSPTVSMWNSSCSRPSAPSTTATITSLGLRHTFIPEWKWFSPTAGIGAAYQYIDDKVPPEAPSDHQSARLRLARCERVHHPAIHVACGLAQVRRLHQSKSE